MCGRLEEGKEAGRLESGEGASTAALESENLEERGGRQLVANTSWSVLRGPGQRAGWGIVLGLLIA